MKIKRLLHVVFLCFSAVCAAKAGDAHAIMPDGTNAPAASLRLFTDKSPAGKIARAILQSGRDQFSFVIPEGFRDTFDSATCTVRLLSRDTPATITVSVQPAPETRDSEINAKSLSARALSDYPGAQIVDQFEVSIGTWHGPAIEVEWPSGAVKKTSIRMAQVHFPNGVLFFTVHAPSNNIRACDYPFNQLLLSLRAGLNGQAADFQQFLPDL